MTESAVAIETPASRSAAMLGHDLVSIIMDQLRTQPDHWSRMNEQQQAKSIDRIKESVRQSINAAAGQLLAGKHPAMTAKLESVTFKDGIKGTIAADAGQMNRHALADHSGKMIMIVMIEPAQFESRMQDIQAAADQPDLFSGDYDPKVDQPGYRRDEPPSAPAGKTWEEIKNGLKSEAKPEDAPESSSDTSESTPRETSGQSEASQDWSGSAPPPPIKPEDEETPQQAHLARVGVLHDRLFAIGMTISLGELQALSIEQTAFAEDWLGKWLDAKPKKRPARPHFLPSFTPIEPPPKAED